MLYALINGEKASASPDLKAKCPLCGKDVFAKCGEFKINHWSHYVKESCSIWYEPDSVWQGKWKHIFGKENSEVLISKDGKKGIADVLTPTNVVLQFRNSSITIKDIEHREAFYGERMLWVINGFDFRDGFSTFYYPDERSATRVHVGRNSFQAVDDSEHNWEADNDKNIRFEWGTPRRVWIGASRPIFIDFGDAYLFSITEWAGQKFGGGKWFSKERFVEKYGGDKNLLKKWDNLEDQDDY